MTGVDMEKYKRIVQYFWDPEPKNDTTPEAPIWCLGQQHTPTELANPQDAGECCSTHSAERLKAPHTVYEELLIPHCAR